MKPKSAVFEGIQRCIFVASTVAAFALSLKANANLLVGYDVTDEFGNFVSGSIGEYSNSGVPLKPSLISGLGIVQDITISDNTLYVLTIAPGTNGAAYGVGAYTTSGQPINPSLISRVAPSLETATAIAVSGNSIFIGTTANNGTVEQYTTSGTLVNPALITELWPDFAVLGDMAISGGNLFVSSVRFGPHDTVGEYSLTGAPINPALISFSNGFASALAVSGSNIYVRNSTNQEERGVDTIAEYTSSGALVNPAFISGLTDPFAIAISGSDIFVGEANLGSPKVGKYTLSGEPIDASLITGVGPAIAVTESVANVPDSFATLWLALPALALFAATRLQRSH